MTTENIKPGGVPVKWFVFPIKPLAKEPPLIGNPLNGASNDPARIAAWRREHPGCNMAVSPRKSNLLIIDVDTKPGKRGLLTYQELDLMHGFPPTYKVWTPSGGFHLYYRGLHVFGLGKHGLGEGIDCPNYTLLPGARFKSPDGKVRLYRADVLSLPVAPAPSWLYEILGEHRAQRAADQSPVVHLDHPANIDRAIKYLHVAKPSRQGDGGEKQLLDVAASLKDMGISEWQAVQLLTDHYNERCEPPWNVGGGGVADDLVVKVHNAFLYATENQPGCDTAEFHFAEPFDCDGVPIPDRPIYPKRKINKTRATRQRRWEGI